MVCYYRYTMICLKCTHCAGSVESDQMHTDWGALCHASLNSPEGVMQNR